MLVDALVSHWKRNFSFSSSSSTPSPSAAADASSSVVNTTGLGHSNNNDTTARTSLHSSSLQHLVFGSPPSSSGNNHEVGVEGEGEEKSVVVGNDEEVGQVERRMLNEIEDNRPMGPLGRRRQYQPLHERHRNSSVVGTVITRIDEDVVREFEEEDQERQQRQQRQVGQQFQNSTLYRSQQLQFRMQQLQMQYYQQQGQGEDDAPEYSEYAEYSDVPLRLHTANIHPPPPSHPTFHQYQYQQRPTHHHQPQPFIGQLSPIVEQDYISPTSLTPVSTSVSRKSTQNSLIISSNGGAHSGGATTRGSSSSLRKPRSTSPPSVFGSDSAVSGGRNLGRKSRSTVTASAFGEEDLTIGIADGGEDREIVPNSTVGRFKILFGDSPVTPITPATATTMSPGGATIGSPMSQYGTPTSGARPNSPSSGPGTAAAGGNVVGEGHGGDALDLTRKSTVFLVVKGLMKSSTFRSFAGVHFTFPPKTIE
jgi:hypothetical protein